MGLARAVTMHADTGCGAPAFMSTRPATSAVDSNSGYASPGAKVTLKLADACVDTSTDDGDSALTSSCSDQSIDCTSNLEVESFAEGVKLQGRTVQVSKAMASVLRHQAASFKLDLRPDGYVPVHQLLACDLLKSIQCTAAELRQVVASDKKQRFTLANIDGALRIRANQGHSMKCVQDDALLRRLCFSDVDLPSACIHGTYSSNLPSILQWGLVAGGRHGPKRRNHVHFTTCLPRRGHVISGMRACCDVAIFVDVHAALRYGLPLLLSSNGVILTPGFQGVVPPWLFAKVVHLDSDLPSEETPCITQPPLAAFERHAMRFACDFEIGIDDEPNFRVVQRLRGDGGQNMRFIEGESPTQTTNVSIRLDARSDQRAPRRTHRAEGTTGPLSIMVRSAKRDHFLEAVGKTVALLSGVHQEYRAFCQMGDLPEPDLVIIANVLQVDVAI